MAQRAVPREDIAVLRESIARLERMKSPGLLDQARKLQEAGFDPAPRHRAPAENVLALGIPGLDTLLGGGLPLEGLVEIRNGQVRDIGAATGFTLASATLYQTGAGSGGPTRPVLWISQAMASQEAGLAYGMGLQTFGLDMRQFLLAVPDKLVEALWIAEAALANGAFSVVVLEIRGNPQGYGPGESRRLQVRAKAAGLPLFLLRQSAEEEAGSARLRLQVHPAPSLLRPLPGGARLSGSIGNPVFEVIAEKHKGAAPDTIFVEWNAHDRRFYPAQPLPLRTPVAGPHPVDLLSAPADGSARPAEMGHVVAFKRAS